jgi:PAS domain S-box-containing protein
MVSSAFVSGQSKYLQWNMRDITDRKRDQEKLLQLSHAVEQSPSVIVITDLAGNIEYVNPRFTQVTGYSREEALGQNPRVLKSGEHPLAFYQDLWATIKSGKVWRGQFLNRKKDGSHYWESASISPVLGSDGKPAHYIAIKEDITEFKKLERIKDDFVSTVSHELRTPLTAIKESLNLVLDGSMGVLSSEQKAFLDIGSRNVDRLTALVASILDFQKLQSGKFNLQLAKCDINEICAAVVTILKSVASKKGLTLQFEAGAGLPPVRVDRDRILQVVTSFVSNGIKFTSEGGVTITTARQGENCLRVSVSDTGIGIKQEEVEQLFRGFTLLGPAEYHLTGSAGLGLAISKGIITQHRGRIGVESTQGKGSVFYFEIPIEERRRSR